MSFFSLSNSHKLPRHQVQHQIQQHCLFNEKNNQTVTYSYPSSMADIQPMQGGAVAILHFGPRKTATTTIQYVLNHPDTKALLGQDSFVYLGRDQTTRTLYGDTARKYVLYCILGGNNCSSNVSNEHDTPFANGTASKHRPNTNDKSKTMHLKWSRFVQKVQQARHNGQNVIVSDEAVPRAIQGRTQYMQQYLNAFAGFGTVRVVFGYRRLFDWIVSEYNEEFKLDTKLVTPFVEWYRHQVHHDTSSNTWSKENGPPPNRWFRVVDGAELRRFHGVFPTICVFNLHYYHDPFHPEEHPCDTRHGLVVEDTIANFLCHMIPETRQACEAACTGRLPEPPVEQQNVSPVTIDFDYIARRVAKELRWKNPDRNQLKDFSLRIQQYSSSVQQDTTTANETINHSSSPTIPMTCLLQDELERLYQKSLAMEHELVPKLYSSNTLTSRTKSYTTMILKQEEKEVVAEKEERNRDRPPRPERELREAFESAVSKGKFCNVDFLQLWSNRTWRTFLEETANHVRFPPSYSKR
jgi:hypothetical protein